MAYGIKDFDTIVSDMIAAIVLRSTKLTDFSPGGVTRTLLEGVGIVLEDFYFATYVGFKEYLQNIQKYVFDFPKKEGTKATANVVFSRTVTTDAATIPIGTEVQTASGLKFFTTAAVNIAISVTDSAAVEVEAAATGTEYNVSAASIVVIANSVPYVDTVTNAAASFGGVTEESDIAYKTRFNLYIAGLGRANKAGILAAALSIEGVTSASILEHFPPVNDFNFTLYVDDGSAGGISAEKVAEVQSLIDGDETDDNPGFRAAGIQALVVGPTVVNQNVTAAIYLSEDVDQEGVGTQIINAITYYMSTLGVGDDIIYTELIYHIMNVFGVVDCDVTVPAANVSIGTNQVGRAGSFSFTYTEV